MLEKNKNFRPPKNMNKLFNALTFKNGKIDRERILERIN